MQRLARIFDFSECTSKNFQIFFYTAFAYMCLHSIRTGWAYIKINFQSESEFSSYFIGTMDLLFLFSYATGMFVNGWLGDKIDLKIFLIIGLLGTSISILMLVFFGMISYYSYILFAVFFTFNGFFQSIGWPSSINILSTTFSERVRGTVLSTWSCNQNIGNISGQMIGHIVLRVWNGHWYNVMQIVTGFTLFSCLLSCSLNIEKKEKDEKKPKDDFSLDSFKEAWRIEGVFEFALTYGFSRSVVLGVIFWLPYYLETINYDKNLILQQIQMFEIGNVIGGIFLGKIIDIYKIGAILFPPFFFIGGLCCMLYYIFQMSYLWSMILIFLIGIFLGGPYNLISSVVSSQLGLKIQGKSLVSTVTGIVIGFGSYFAAIFQQLIPFFVNSIFQVFCIMCIFAGLVITPIVWHDYKILKEKEKNENKDFYVELEKI